MPDSERLKELAFDFYERYTLLDRIGGFFRPPDRQYRVLDVGGHTPAFWPGFPSMAAVMVPDASVAVVDVIPGSELKNYIRASGLDLPFPDGAFDLVCSLDTLEHIPAEHRPLLLSELLRVTRDGLYLAFPFDSPSNRWAESILVDYTSVLLKDPVPALLEHRQFGLPDRGQVDHWLSENGYSCIGFEQGNTDVWLLMMMTYFSLRVPGTDFIQELNRRFNQVYASQDWAAPAYRAGYVLSKNRPASDLETLKASFVSTEKRADLQAVLSFCQLFLNIAQNGRVTADKDRHIRNVESELAALQARREELLQEAGQLKESLQQTAAEREALSARSEALSAEREALSAKSETLSAERETLATELDQTQRQLSEQSRQLSEQIMENRQLRQEIAAIGAQLEEVRRTARDLEQRSARLENASLESQARLDDRLRQLEIGLVTNRRAIQAIYDSRIWKSLRALGGLILRGTGRTETRPVAPSYADPESAARATRTVRQEQSGELMVLVCDHPGTRDLVPVRDVVEIRGWALAASGIERVLVRIGNGPEMPASYGIPRQDVGRGHPEIAGSENSGYRFFWDTAGLPEGPVTVYVTAIARSGRQQDLTCNVVIDWSSSPGYDLWIARKEPGPEEKRRMKADVDKFAVRPRISIVVPVYKTPQPVLARCIESVKSQLYPDWELCLADDGSNSPAITALLKECSQTDSRIRTVALPHNRGIAAATNSAIGLAGGEYIGFLDHDDELAGFALWEVARAINEHPETDLFYSDEDKIDEQGRRYDPFFKPGWSPELFLSCNYICHFVVMKRSLLERLGGLDESYNGSQDYEFLLRATEQTQRIRRIPKILYHWRSLPGSTATAIAEKPRASGEGRRALAAHLTRTAPGATVDEVNTCRYRVRYPISGDPRVSLLVPTNGNLNLFRAALEDVLEKTLYRNYDILLIDNSRSTRVEEYAERLASRKAPVRYIDWRNQPFNFSTMNNEAARRTDSPYIVFLNDDITVITPEWLSAMLEHAQRPEIGAVGAQLWYPNDLIQHAGVVMGLYGNCSHAFKNLPAGRPHYFDFPDLIRDCTAVTGACLMIARQKFFEVGGFDQQNLAVAFQDVDLCLKLLDLGYRNVYTPYARLYHYESASKTEYDKIPHPAEDNFMKQKWARYIADDPYYNPNLARRSEDFSLAVD